MIKRVLQKIYMRDKIKPMKRVRFITLFLSLIIVLSLTSCTLSQSKTRQNVNKITQDLMSSCFKVYIYEDGFFSSRLSSEGSSVAFYRNDSYIYLLTNNHVVSTNASHYHYSVVDCYGNEINATLLFKSADYDLAVLRIIADNYAVLSFAKNKPAIGSEVYSVGYPKSQNNAITIGSYMEDAIPPEVESIYSNVQFECIKHNSYITNGSSGCVLLDYDLNIFGINYMGSLSDQGEFICGYAIPFDKVQEFLSLNSFGE